MLSWLKVVIFGMHSISCFYVGWMRGALACNGSLSPGYWSMCKAALHTINVVATPNQKLRASTHGVTNPNSQFTWGQSMQSQPLTTWRVGTYHFTHGLKCKVPGMTWMPHWQHFLEVRFMTCVKSQAKKLDPTFDNITIVNTRVDFQA